MPYRAVIFDLDGTLLDTLADIAAAANWALSQEGCPTHLEEAFRQFVGEGVARLFEQALPAARRAPETISRCVTGFRASYAACWNHRTRPYSGVAEMIAALISRAVDLAVLSNKPHDFTRRCIAHYFPGVPFRTVLGQRERILPKPDPAGALEIARDLKIPPAEVVYLGDSAVDMQTARRAGMFPVGATWGFRSRQELIEAGAACLIDQPEQLLEIVDLPL